MSTSSTTMLTSIPSWRPCPAAATVGWSAAQSASTIRPGSSARPSSTYQPASAVTVRSSRSRQRDADERPTSATHRQGYDRSTATGRACRLWSPEGQARPAGPRRRPRAARERGGRSPPRFSRRSVPLRATGSRENRPGGGRGRRPARVAAGPLRLLDVGAQRRALGVGALPGVLVVEHQRWLGIAVGQGALDVERRGVAAPVRGVEPSLGHDRARGLRARPVTWCPAGDLDRATLRCDDRRRG